MKKPLSTLALALSLTFMGACSSTSDQQNNETLTQTFRVSQGMEVQLEKPQGFKLTREHYGFVQPETFSRIKVNEVEVPYEQYLTNLTTENLLKSQLQLLKTENVVVNGANCTLLTLRQIIAGTYYEKLWLVAGDSLSSLKIEASYPESSNKQHKDVIKQSLFSAAVQTDDDARLYTGLPFLFTGIDNFKIVQRNLNSVVLVSENFPNASVVVSHGKLSSEMENIESLSHHFLNNSKSLSDVEITKDEPIKIDGIPAIATQAYVTKGDLPAWVYQVTSSQKGKFLLIQALSNKVDRKPFSKELESLISQFKFRSI
ncbi:hypothetical protein AN214_01387 [Pseudoalteromonas sp. P1-9]|uniref:hypothetical protein n=1 Tax=Pseudoalteromonas sp. P1-9 TaxID=1710354 RepID=UPI0006D5F8F2|nr:hypothetical protein [Pseudoalteromonas sp. P1-9]KPV96566.1 hypothetical protein AN214_01387 [Pseudoalteromonas sp. P1-9]